MLRAVIFDVDFTLSRPGPELGPDAYRRVGLAHGLDLDPGRYEAARLAAMEDLHREERLALISKLVHFFKRREPSRRH